MNLDLELIEMLNTPLAKQAARSQPVYPLEFFTTRLDKLPKVTTVFRIEHKDDASGPYGTKGWQRTPHTPAYGRSTPNADDGFQSVFPEDLQRFWFDFYKRSELKEVKFGFSSLEQLKKWFHNETELNTLKSLGFIIKEYNNVSGVDSGTQVIFSENV